MVSISKILLLLLLFTNISYSYANSDNEILNIYTADVLEINYFFSEDLYEVHPVEENKNVYLTNKLLFVQAIFWEEGKVRHFILLHDNFTDSIPPPKINDKIKSVKQNNFRNRDVLIDYQNGIFYKYDGGDVLKIKFKAITESYTTYDPEADYRARNFITNNDNKWLFNRNIKK